MDNSLPLGSFPNPSSASLSSRSSADIQKPDETGSFDQWTKVFRKQFEKTEMCRFYPQNKCKYGSRCAFAHYPDEIRRPPVLDKTAICRAWSEGTCPLSAKECRFAHGRGELRFTDTVKTVMKKDRSIHPQKMSPVQPDDRGIRELQGHFRQGDDPNSSLQDIGSPSFTALIQELQSSVLSDISRAVNKASALGPPQQDEPQYLHPALLAKASSPFMGMAHLDVPIPRGPNDRPTVDGKGRSSGRQGYPDVARRPVPKFCGCCGAPRLPDHVFCGECGQEL